MSYRKSQVNVSSLAESDLAGILDFSERRWGQHQRHAYSTILEHAIDTLVTAPGIGRSRDELLPGLKSHPAGSHIIYYLPLKNELRIMRVLHERRDPSLEEW